MTARSRHHCLMIANRVNIIQYTLHSMKEVQHLHKSQSIRDMGRGQSGDRDMGR